MTCDVVSLSSIFVRIIQWTSYLCTLSLEPSSVHPGCTDVVLCVPQFLISSCQTQPETIPDRGSISSSEAAQLHIDLRYPAGHQPDEPRVFVRSADVSRELEEAQVGDAGPNGQCHRPCRSGIVQRRCCSGDGREPAGAGTQGEKESDKYAMDAGRGAEAQNDERCGKQLERNRKGRQTQIQI